MPFPTMSLADALARRRAMETGELWASDILGGWLWLGSGQNASLLGQLQSRGITHVLNCADDVPNFHEGDPAASFLTYRCLGIADFGGDAGIRRTFPAAAAFVRAARASRGGTGRVLVHCANGSNRSATVAMALLMDTQGMTLAQAWALVKARRPAASPLADNRAQLLQHELATAAAAAAAAAPPAAAAAAAAASMEEGPGGILVPVQAPRCNAGAPAAVAAPSARLAAVCAAAPAAPPPASPSLAPPPAPPSLAERKAALAGAGLAGLERRACAHDGRVVVFDFDRTLSVRHVGPFDVRAVRAGSSAVLHQSSSAGRRAPPSLGEAAQAADQLVARCFGGRARVAALGVLLAELEAAGCELWVVTRNSAHTVGRALGGTGLARHFAGIVGSELFGFKEGKSAAIQAHVLHPARRRCGSGSGGGGGGGGGQRGVLFVDDSAAEIAEVGAALGCATLHAAQQRGGDDGGMGEADFAAVRAWLHADPPTHAEEPLAGESRSDAWCQGGRGTAE